MGMGISVANHTCSLLHVTVAYLLSEGDTAKEAKPKKKIVRKKKVGGSKASTAGSRVKRAAKGMGKKKGSNVGTAAGKKKKGGSPRPGK